MICTGSTIHVRGDADLSADFVEGRGDDEGRVETGFHLLQGNGGTLLFQGCMSIETVADAIGHIGFAQRDGRFRGAGGADRYEDRGR